MAPRQTLLISFHLSYDTLGLTPKIQTSLLHFCHAAVNNQKNKLTENLNFRRVTRKEEFQDEDLLGDNDGEIDEMTLRLDNLTREIEKAKLRQKVMMNAVDQQRDILLAVADQVGVEINLPSRVKIE